MAVEISSGKYDNNLSELITKAREIFRIAQLGEIARAKVASLPGVDEIEVYLAYQVGLREVLELPSGVDAMAYRSMSEVSDGDLNTAAAQVKQAEASGFPRWLAEWAAWKNVLTRIAPDEVQAAANIRETELENIFNERLNAALSSSGVNIDTDAYADAKRELGAQVLSELNAEMDIRTTEQVLTRLNSLALLDNPWPHDPNQQNGSDGAGASSAHKLLTFEQLRKIGAWSLSDIVSEFTDKGASLRFAPQGILLDDGAQGVCDSLSEAWLLTLSEDNAGVLKNILLDNVFLRSRYLTGGARTQGSTEGISSADTQAFLNVLGKLHSTGTRTIQSLDDIVNSLTTATGELSLSLQTGNHALALARRTINGVVSYLFYDPNFGEVSLPVSGSESGQAASLKSLLNAILGMDIGNGRETLADYYQTDTRSGEYSFLVQTVDPEAQAARPEYQALRDQLRTVPAIAELSTLSSGALMPHTPSLSAPMQALLNHEESALANIESRQSRIVAAQSIQDSFQVGHDASIVWQDAIASAMKELRGQGVTGIKFTAAPSDDGRTVLVITGKKANEEVFSQSLDLTDSVTHAISILDSGDVHVQSESGMTTFNKSFGLYSFLTSLAGLWGSMARDDTQGEAINGTFLAMSVADITGVMDTLANRFAAQLGIVADVEKFGGGLNGLLGKGVSSLSEFIGFGERGAQMLGDVAASVPVLQAVLTGFTVYSDVNALMHASNEDQQHRAIGTLTTDSITGALATASTVATLAGTISGTVGGAVGGVAAVAAILIDAAINPEDPLGFRELYGNTEYNVAVNTLDSLDNDKADDPHKLYQVKPAEPSSQTGGGTLSFSVLDGQKLSDASQVTGDMVVALNADGRGFDFSWTNSAGHRPSGPMDADDAMAQGPERFHREMTTDITVNDVVMGMGTTYTVAYDYEHYGHMELAEWSEGDRPVWNERAPQVQNMADLVSGIKTLPVVASRHFTVTGNDNGNRFISGYGDKATPYLYTVSGEGGDDSLLTGFYGQYAFDGGANTDNGDWVIASQQAIDNHGEFTVYDMQAGADMTSLAQQYMPQGHSLRENFNITLTNVENFVGSANNELVRGSSERNVIFTGGGDDVIWLSGGGDVYTIEPGAGGTTFVGDMSRTPDRIRDDVRLLATTWEGASIEGSSIALPDSGHIELDERAREQLVFSLKDGSNLFYEGGTSPGWVLSTPRTSSVPAVYPSLLLSSELSVFGPSNAVIQLPTGAYHVPMGVQHILMESEELGSTWHADYVRKDVMVAGMAEFTLAGVTIEIAEEFNSLNSMLFKQLCTHLPPDGLSHTMLTSSDGVSFHFAIPKGGAEKDAVLVVDSIDVARFRGDSFCAEIGQRQVMQDIAGMVVDVTTLVNAGALLINSDVAPQRSYLYHSGAMLNVDNLQALLNSQSKVNNSWQLPDGKLLYTMASAEPASVDGGFALQITDGDNVLTEHFTQGVVTQVLYEVASSFDAAYMAGLYGLAESVSGMHLTSKNKELLVKTIDGVSFHFDVNILNGKEHRVVVIDNIDLDAYQAHHDGSTFNLMHINPFVGVDNVVMDITGIVQHQWVISTEGSAVQNTMVYRSGTVLTADMLASELSIRQDGEGYTLMLPDGHEMKTATQDDLINKNFQIECGDGSRWTVVFAKNDEGTPYISEAQDLTGQHHVMVSAGKMLAVYSGDIVHSAGATVDLSQGVQSDGELLSGVSTVYGSRFSDQLTGDHHDNELIGGEGNDILSGGGGVDLLLGGAGSDTYLVRAGDHIIVSAKENGNDTDTLQLQGTTLDDLSVAMYGDDLIVQGTGSQVVLKDWGKGDTHYDLALSDRQMHASQFEQFVQTRLSMTQAIQELSSYYQHMPQEHAQGAIPSQAPEMVRQVMDQNKWNIISGQGVIERNEAGDFALEGQVVVSEATGQQLDSNADYRILVEFESTPDAMAALHPHLVVGGQRLQELPRAHDEPKPQSNGYDGYVAHHMEVDIDGASLIAGLAGANRELSIEIEQDLCDTSPLIHSVQLEKLVGAMATFDVNAAGARETGQLLQRETAMPYVTVVHA